MRQILLNISVVSFIPELPPQARLRAYEAPAELPITAADAAG